MTSRLNRFKEALAQQEQRTQNNDTFPFYDMPVDTSVTVRFLPDKDDTNPMMFMLKHQTHVLTLDGKKRTVNCLRSYEEDCPICKKSSDFYNDKDETGGKALYRKLAFYTRVLVVKSGSLVDSEGKSYNGRVMTMRITPQIQKLIIARINDEDEPLQYDLDCIDNGCDFIIKKTFDGQYNSYNIGTRFAANTRPLTDVERAAHYDSHVTLESLRPKKPELDYVERALESHLTGATFAENGGDGSEASQPAAPRQAASPATQPKPSGAANSDVEAILAKLKGKG